MVNKLRASKRRYTGRSEADKNLKRFRQREAYIELRMPLPHQSQHVPLQNKSRSSFSCNQRIHKTPEHVHASELPCSTSKCSIHLQGYVENV